MSIVCYDSNGNVVEKFYQWDINQTITVTGIPTSPIPKFHFCNRKSKSAYVVTPTLSGSSLTAHIPNILFKEPETINVYIYQDTPDDGGRTVYSIKIPIVQRQIPNDYEYEEDIPDAPDYEFIIHDLVTQDGIVNADEIPFYDISAGGNRKTTFSNIISKIRDSIQSVFYQKPSTGIPKTDMNSSVQASLTKADSSVQPSTLTTYATKTYADGLVQANPTGTSAGTLSSIKIGDTKYNVPQGGGGGAGIVIVTETGGVSSMSAYEIMLSSAVNIIEFHSNGYVLHLKMTNGSSAEFAGVVTYNGYPTVLEAVIDGNNVEYYSMVIQDTNIIDSGGYFTSDTVNGALQEIGATLNGVNTLLGGVI